MNLEKIKESARKYEAAQDWRRAIEVYQKAIQEFESGKDPSPDVGVYNKVGDLHIKANEPAAAVQVFERAVDLYTDQGLTNNAIALCGKILRVHPEDLAAERDGVVGEPLVGVEIDGTLEDLHRRGRFVGLDVQVADLVVHADVRRGVLPGLELLDRLLVHLDRAAPILRRFVLPGRLFDLLEVHPGRTEREVGRRLREPSIIPAAGTRSKPSPGRTSSCLTPAGPAPRARSTPGAAPCRGPGAGRPRAARSPLAGSGHTAPGPRAPA